MELFKVSWPLKSMPNTTSLYFHSRRATVVYDGDEPQYLQMHHQDKVSFNTFFNCFSYSQYLKYTKVDSVQFRLVLQGDFQIYLMILRSDNNTEHCIMNTSFNSLEPAVWNQTWDFNNEHKDVQGIVYLKLISNCNNSRIYGGGYESETKPNPNIRVGINICSFKREYFVKRNVEQICKKLLDSEHSTVRDSLEIFVIDNGQTLHEHLEKHPKLHLFNNRNYGGSGGFTRGIIEISKADNSYSHILMMDDDVVIDVHVLEKLVNFLRVISNDYSDLHIAGGMMPLDNPTFQYEATAIWDGLGHPLKNMYLNCPENLLKQEKQDFGQYGGWWFFCMPAQLINESNLPMPLFIKGDDTDYGLRNINNMITLNGIGIWHEAFDKKYSPHLEYFWTRNDFVVNLRHGYLKNRFGVVMHLFKKSVFAMLIHRYEVVDFITKAINDHLKGIDFYLHQKEDELLKGLLAMNPKLVDKETLLKQGYIVSEKNYSDNKRYMKRTHRYITDPLTLYGVLIPKIFYKKQVITVDLVSGRPCDYYLKRTVIHWNPHEKRGYVTEVSKMKFWKGIFLYSVAAFKYLIKSKRVNREYMKRIGEITSLEYWEKHLGIIKKFD